jgi:hypothetical protein
VLDGSLNNLPVLSVLRRDRNKTLGRSRRMWEDNIKMNVQHVGWEDKDWIDLDQDKDGRL